MKKFKHLDPINLTEAKSDKALTEAMRRWQAGECQLMIAHPASVGFGIDGLQKRGNIVVWFGLNWSAELVGQENARLHRQGQGRPVFCHRILCRDTMDQVQADVLEDKVTTENSLRRAITEYRKQRRM